MNWKEQLEKYEQSKDWESAIELMQKVIDGAPYDLDAYLFVCYLLMNLLVEEDYDRSKHDYYAGLLKKYFLESYSKFLENPEYLFYIGKIAYMSEWYFGIEIEEAEAMMKNAAKLEPKNILYKWASFGGLDIRDASNRNKIILYAKEALSSPVVTNTLKKSKGALGRYLLNALEYWNKAY